ncbi:MAG: 4Fe-4S dicluster domain-containing protein [Candidatus Methanoliparum thermophilum]|uniref:4Fe-4S dicluster domain-containing protein n=1 Tax=Methanoliparum thermophilum TaxID=2491083 RepID=A0A520KRF1_METT2|nr:MAG: 4Fe-4S dicluster domain-containing protein [Candidatus Methanoliparum thermophilum]
MSKLIFCDMNKCTNCRLCVYACSFVKTKKFSITKSRIKVLDKDHEVSVAVACNHCEDAPCVAYCPTKALENNEGIIKIHEEKCIGCGWCIIHCPVGAISFDADKRVVAICDICDGDPECVKICPINALEIIEDREEYTRKMHEIGLKTVKELI